MFIYLIFYAYQNLRFLDVGSNQGEQRLVPALCRILCSNVFCWSGKLSDLTVASSQYVILLCSETFTVLLLCSQICVTCRSCWFLDLVALSCAGARCLGPEGRLCMCETDMEHSTNPNLSTVVANGGFEGLWCVTELLCVQSLPQPWPR